MKWTEEKKRKLAAGEMEGAFAGPDHSYPIADSSDVGDAWGLAGHAPDPDAVRRRIISIAKKHGWTGGLPAAAKKWAEEHNIALKAANLHDYVVSRIHSSFTVMADDMLGNGIVTHDERIALSSAIGDALDAFNGVLDEKVPDLRKRRPWDEAEPMMPMNDMAMSDSRSAPLGRPIKALGANRIGEYGVLWGDKVQKDITGEYFTSDTEELTAIYKAMGKIPTLYHHAMDGTVKTTVVGAIDVMEPDDVGLWVEAQLKAGDEYHEAIHKLVAAGKLHWSSGTLPGARKVAADGRIERWPIVELSMTRTPAEYRMLERPIGEVKAYYQAIGLEFETKDETSKGVEDTRNVVGARLGLLALLELESELVT